MEERIVELETRLAFHEDAIQHLNRTVAEQQRLIDALNESLDQLKQRLQSLDPSPIDGDTAEPPPPHY